MEKVFDSADFAAGHALDAWADFTRSAVMPTAFRLVDIEVFSGWFTTMQLGATQLSGMSYSSFRTVRSPALIRASDPECLQIALVGSGPHVIEQNGQTASARPGELLLFDSSHPFDAYADGESLLLQFPRTLLPVRARHLDRAIARTFPAGDGIGGLLAHFLLHLADGDIHYTPQDTARLGTVALDLATAFLAHHLDRETDVSAETRHRSMFLRVTAFIGEHLGDPGLTADDVAVAHHMSIRTLHRLFQQHGTSVRTWIRTRRLEGCGHDLADPAKRHLPIHAVAARWGFPRPADFTRAFRAYYGTTPSDYRDQALRHSTVAGA
ncbi:helix-turn-helix domain-containing protein [Embleya sp. NPDC050154]|uniref:helix-turn-helix domain-containing protein n=1 Tax=Embleya sp. NPDC050154 TaxID=3363988 RepID=UPI0037988A30